MKRSCIFLLFVAVLVGCAPSRSTLEGEIVSAPDEWSVGFDFGATSNNYALLAHIMSLSNHLERIRLSRLARDHFRHSPEWLLSHLDNPYKEEQRFAFICNCSRKLICAVDASPEMIMEGWKMEAELLNDLESLIGLTERDWNNGKHPGRMSRERRRRYNYAYRVRHRYMIYFKFNLPSCIGSYHRLPASHRDVFLQQIRADFFGRRGIEHVDWKHFPAPFQRLTSGSSRVSASNEE